MEKTPCPGCAAPMELDQEVCEACRRPRDEAEIEAGYEAIREREREKRRRPKVRARRALLAAAVVGLFLARGLIFGQLKAWHDSFMTELDKIADAPPGTPPKTAQGAAILNMMGRGTPPPADEDGGPTSASPFASSPRRAPSAAASETPRLTRRNSWSAKTPPPQAPPQPAHRLAAAAPEPPQPKAGGVVVYGVVYDLETGFAIPSAVVRFSGPSGVSPFFTSTDEDGRYRLELSLVSRQEPFSATAEAIGFRPGQIEDPPAPYRERPEAERREILAELTEKDLEPVPVRIPPTAMTYPLDLVLAPAKPAAGKTP